jgi:hypothetical protein
MVYLRPDLIHSLRKVVRDELALLRRLALDRRDASTRLPILRRTGPQALHIKPKVEKA